MSMVPLPVIDIIHFYYCLSVAIDINKQSKKNITPVHTNIFVLKWLDNANKNKIFNSSVQAEITWLTKYIKSKGPLFQNTERLVDGIYDACINLMNGKK